MARGRSSKSRLAKVPLVSPMSTNFFACLDVAVDLEEILEAAAPSSDSLASTAPATVNGIYGIKQNTEAELQDGQWEDSSIKYDSMSSVISGLNIASESSTKVAALVAEDLIEDLSVFYESFGRSIINRPNTGNPVENGMYFTSHKDTLASLIASHNLDSSMPSNGQETPIVTPWLFLRRTRSLNNLSCPSRVHEALLDTGILQVDSVVILRALQEEQDKNKRLEHDMEVMQKQIQKLEDQLANQFAFLEDQALYLKGVVEKPNCRPEIPLTPATTGGRISHASTDLDESSLPHYQS